MLIYVDNILIFSAFDVENVGNLVQKEVCYPSILGFLDFGFILLVL